MRADIAGAAALAGIVAAALSFGGVHVRNGNDAVAETEAEIKVLHSFTDMFRALSADLEERQEELSREAERLEHRLTSTEGFLS